MQYKKAKKNMIVTFPWLLVLEILSAPIGRSYTKDVTFAVLKFIINQRIVILSYSSQTNENKCKDKQKTLDAEIGFFMKVCKRGRTN